MNSGRLSFVLILVKLNCVWLVWVSVINGVMVSLVLCSRCLVMFLFIQVVEFSILELMNGRFVMCSIFCRELFLFSVLWMIGKIILMVVSGWLFLVLISCCVLWFGICVRVIVEGCRVMWVGFCVLSRQLLVLLICYSFCLLIFNRIILKCDLLIVFMIFFVDCSDILCFVDLLLKMILIFIFVILIFIQIILKGIIYYVKLLSGCYNIYLIN